MEPTAFGYRPQRGATEAIEAVMVLLRQGYTDVVDADLSRYFDSVPHAELMKSVAFEDPTTSSPIRRIVESSSFRIPNANSALASSPRSASRQGSNHALSDRY